MKIKRCISVILCTAAFWACSSEEIPSACPEGKSPVTVTVAAVNAAEESSFDILSKTAIDADGHSVRWLPDDCLSLWAWNSSGDATLSGQPFYVFGSAAARAFFSAELDRQMPADTYIYKSVSPAPATVSGSKLTFTIPSSQDGAGAGICCSDAVTGTALRTQKDPDGGEMVRLPMHQMLHLLKFYVRDDQNLLGGEPVRKIKLTFPRTVVGTLNMDLSDASLSTTLTSGSKELILNLGEYLPASPATGDRRYAYAAIHPVDWTSSDKLAVKLYTDTKVAVVEDISLKARSMEAGHATPIRLVPASVSDFFKLGVRLDENPLGEPVQKIVLSAPSGCRWGDAGSNTCTLNVPAGIPVGSVHTFEFEEAENFRAFSGKTFTATFDSEHITTSRSISVGTLGTGVMSKTLGMKVPWLLKEDFSSVSSFSSNDEYKTSSAGAKNPTSFLSGWTGARCGASAGKCIRIACRRETSADYDARVDSAPLTGRIKKAVNLAVEFDYGANNKYGGIPIITNGDVGQNVYVGYVTDKKGYKSNSTDGHFKNPEGEENTFYIKEYDGSWTNTPKNNVFRLPAPAGDVLRISWRSAVEHQAGTTNTTAWLYIDNVKVTVAP